MWVPIDRKQPVLLDDYVFHPNSGCIPQPQPPLVAVSLACLSMIHAPIILHTMFTIVPFQVWQNK
jgi:hypothetical protein